MRCNPFPFLVMSLAAFLVESLTLGLSDEVGFFDPDSYNDPPISLDEPASFLADADLKIQPVGEPVFPDSLGSLGDSDDLFETDDHSSISNLPDGGSTHSDALVALDPSSSSLDQMQAGLPPSDADSSTNETPQDLGETLNNHINEGLNFLLRFASPFGGECDLKLVGKVPLCCTSPRRELPFAYGCSHMTDQIPPVNPIIFNSAVWDTIQSTMKVLLVPKASMSKIRRFIRRRHLEENLRHDPFNKRGEACSNRQPANFFLAVIATFFYYWIRMHNYLLVHTIHNRRQIQDPISYSTFAWPFDKIGKVFAGSISINLAS